MAKRKIVWSEIALKRFKSILHFYNHRNGSKEYSLKLAIKINQQISLLGNHPNIGKLTDFEDVRAFIIEKFIIYYQVLPSKIVILTIWDSAQDLKNLSFER